MEMESKFVILEGARDNALSVFIPLFQKRGIDITISKLKQFLLNKFVTEANINNLSLRSNYYLVGVARYYFNGDLTSNVKLNALYPNVTDKFDQEVCTRLNALIEILRNAYIDSVGEKFEQPEDFGKLTIQQLFRKYNKKINQALGIGVPNKTEEEPQISQDYNASSNYTYDILYSYDDAKKYKTATSPGAWCITYGEQHYNAYVRRLKIHYVIFRQNGYENVPRKRGEGFTYRKPHDAYGNSLIAVLQSNFNGEPIYITSRWNHGSSVDGTSGIEADHAYTKEEFLNVIGCDESVLTRAFEQWKATVAANKKSGVDRKALNAEKLAALRGFKYYQMLMNNGVHPKELYDKYGIKFFALDKTSGEDTKNVMGSYSVVMQINDKQYVTVMYKRRMLFDSMMLEITNNNGILKRGANYCVLGDSRWTKKGYWIYDLLHHKFVDAEGVVRFKNVNPGLFTTYEEYHYAVLALSANQEALLNIDKMEFVKAKNGGVWFEEICRTKGFNTKSLPYGVDDDLLRLTYDSSAGEIYVYDTTDGHFVKTEDEDGFEYYNNVSQRLKGYIELKKPSDNGRWLKKMINVKTNEPLTIDGHDVFEEIEGVNGVIGYKLPNDEWCYYYDMTIGKQIMFDRTSPLVTKTNIRIQDYYGISQGNYVFISVMDGTTYFDWKRVVIYNILTHKLYEDDISGKLFHIYGTSHGIVMSYVPNGNGEKYALKTAMQDYQDQERLNKLGESFKNEFKRILNEMDEYYKKIW